MKKTTRIWCTYHDPQQLIDYNLYDTDILKLFYTNDFSLKRDNINELNTYLSELVTYYYVWKNNIKTDYVGFCHYRRHFSNINYKYINDHSIQAYLGWPEKLKNISTYYGEDKTQINNNLIYKHFNEYMKIKCDIDIDKRISQDRDLYITKNITYIFTWKTFIKICDILFGFLDYLANELNLDTWKTLPNIIKIHEYFLFDKNNYDRTRMLSEVFEYIIGNIISLKGYHIYIENIDETKPCIIYNIDNIENLDKFFKMYKLNIKTGIRQFINIANYNFDDINPWNRYLMEYVTYIKYNDINNFLKKYKNIIILKENEYIDCIDSFNFNKGNYTIKQIADS